MTERESAWLIEWPEDDNVPVRWWNPATGWMRDANKALWFARESDAADYIAAGHWVTGVKQTEHIFVGGGVAQEAWECGARKQGTPGGNAPADCDWPGCGCDPAVNKMLEAIDEAGFEIVRKPSPIPWNVSWNRSYEPVETRAAEIYETFDYAGPGKMPRWQPGGNSLKQDEARSVARRELMEAGHTPSVSSTVLSPAARPTIVGKVSGKAREADQVPGMPHAICHACGLGYKCLDEDCPNTKPNPMFGGGA